MSLHYAKHFEASTFLKKILWLQLTHNLVSITHTSISEQQRRFMIDIGSKFPYTHMHTCTGTHTHTHRLQSLECERMPKLWIPSSLSSSKNGPMPSLYTGLPNGQGKCLTFQRIIPTFPSHHWVVGIFLHIWRQGGGSWKWGQYHGVQVNELWREHAAVSVILS